MLLCNQNSTLKKQDTLIGKQLKLYVMIANEGEIIMGNNFEEFLSTIDSHNTVKVANSMRTIGDYDYSDFTPVDLEQVILSLKPNSPKAITTICYILGMYAKFLGNDNLYHMVKGVDRGAIWLMAKPAATKKFISHSSFESVYHEIGVYEEHNSFYQQTLFRCLYEGIYNDDMSVIKNLRASDVSENAVTLREDNGNVYELLVSDRLANDLRALGCVDIWERNNRFGVCKIKTTGLHTDTCFKVENRKGSKENAYRYTYYRILRKISKEYLEYNLLPLQIYVSGIMHRIKMNLKEHDIALKEGFSDMNKNRLVRKIISEELIRSNCNTEVKNFREMVKGHLEMFID